MTFRFCYLLHLPFPDELAPATVSLQQLCVCSTIAERNKVPVNKTYASVCVCCDEKPCRNSHSLHSPWLNFDSKSFQRCPWWRCECKCINLCLCPRLCICMSEMKRKICKGEEKNSTCDAAAALPSSAVSFIRFTRERETNLGHI